MRPKVVVLLGAVAFRWAMNWVRRPYRIGESRGILSGCRPELGACAVVLTYHPAYLARNPERTRYALEDWTHAARLAGVVVPGLVGGPVGDGRPAGAVGPDAAAEGAGAAAYSPEYWGPFEGLVFLDLETTGLDPYEPGAKVLCTGHAMGSGEVHVDSGAACPPSTEVIVGHNVKFDILWGRYNPSQVWDTQLMAHLVDAGAPSKSLEAQCKSRLGVSPWKIDRSNMADVPTSILLDYNQVDVEMTRSLFQILAGEIHRHGLEKVCRFDHEVLLSLVSMERQGVRVDLPELMRMIDEYELAQVRQQAVLAKLADRVLLNPRSHQQLEDVLYRDKRFIPPKVTPGGQPAVDAEALSLLRQAHPDDIFLQELQVYSKREKILSSFLRCWEKYVWDGYIHPTYNMTRTPTGRFSCSRPNFQQVPKEHKAPIKKLVVSRWGDRGVILAADYSQLELRVAAYFTEDENLLRAFREGLDIHEMTRSAFFSGPPLAGQREVAKRVNFGIFYGIGAPGLATATGVTVAQAGRFRAAWHAQYPGAKRWIDAVHEELHRHSALETPFGRRRRWDLVGLNLKQMAHAEAAAQNFPVQSLASDLCKLAMVKVSRELLRYDAVLIGQIHDELLFDVPVEELEDVKRIVRGCMVEPGTQDYGFTFDVPLEVSMGWGKTWLAAKTMEE